MRRALIPLGLGLPAAVLIGELYRHIFRREDSRLLGPLLESFGHRADYYVHRDECAERLRALPHERFSIRSARGERLCGFYYPASGEGKRIAFLVHGYRSEHAETAGMYYDYYASRGFDLFCCDHTAHGESEGKQIGFDVYESEDCLLWLEELRRRFGEELRIVLHGFSMGAATVMKMASRCPDSVRLIVEDSGYADAKTQLRAQLGPLLAPLEPLNRLFAGYDLRDSDVRPSLDASRIPMLFVHGTEDPSVPFENGPALYARYRGEKDCLFVEGARHIETMHLAPEEYARKLDAMIARAIST